MAARWMEMIRDIVSPDRETHAIPSMDGPLRPNNRLDDCEVILGEGEIIKPDDVTFGNDGALYISSQNSVFRHTTDTGLVEFAIFDSAVGAITCLSNGGIAVCLDGTGVQIKGGPMEGARLDSVDGVPIVCPTAVTESDDGHLYICQGSSQHSASDWVHDLMEKNRSGRVLRWHPEQGTSEVLADNLAYPNGILVEEDGQKLVVCESWSHSLFRMSSDPKVTFKREVLIPNLPGYPGRICARENGGFWLALFGMRTEMLEFVLEEDDYRQEMMETIDPEYWVRPKLEPERHFLEPLQGGGFRVLGIIKPWAPPRSYGLVVRLDEDFEIVGSMHSRADGKVHGVTGLASWSGKAVAAAKGSEMVICIEQGGQ
ncbi:SMP-30/gluconolactonase/LRE family protein [Sneathiella sp. HT1-7]|uniref:SMP-30/gluconolactonase/LRE family protein n=1 Tax=Sneathiella sp. HT1-7 TaxID=2887192 RepID=UPI001D137A6C|nr:SMP-30/gluconolactonase/LRE family protein [Sneathiella sp. HT1-7]MCC3305152.1 SMP-30/gluconolactonase/LRE family protein [Sneathiella sp. HT1-7]